MSVTLRSWASRTLLSFSGWEEREGGERRRVRGAAVLLDCRDGELLRFDVVSNITEGAMAHL